jgi:hypothetical protein
MVLYVCRYHSRGLHAVGTVPPNIEGEPLGYQLEHTDLIYIYEGGRKKFCVYGK